MHGWRGAGAPGGLRPCHEREGLDRLWVRLPSSGLPALTVLIIYMSSSCGSTFYLSPETNGGIRERVDSYATAPNDVWSLGVILTNLCCGRNPYDPSLFHSLSTSFLGPLTIGHLSAP